MSPQSDIERAFRRGVRWSLLGSAGGMLFQFLQMVVFARLSTPSEAGDYALAATLVGFLTPVAEAGLSQAVVQAREIRPDQLATLAWINFCLGLVILLLLWLGGPALAGWYGRPVLAGLLLLMGASLLVTPFGAQHSGLLVRELRFDATAKIEVISGAAGFAVMVLLAWKGWGAWSLAWAFVLRNAVASLGCLLVARLQHPVRWLRLAPWGAVKPFLRFGFFDLTGRWADFLANYLDKLIVGKWLGAAALGFYNLAFTLSVLPTARVASVVTRVTFPVFARLANAPSSLQAFFNRSVKQVSLALFPLYLGMALFSKEIILLLYGQNWLPAAPVLVAFALGGLVRTLAAVFPHLLKGLGKPDLLLRWMLVWTLAINAFLVAALWFKPEIATAAWSRFFAKITVEIALLYWLAWRCGLAFQPLLRWAGKLALWMSLAGALAWGAGALVHDFWMAMVVKSLVFAAGLAAGFGLIGRNELRALWKGEHE